MNDGQPVKGGGALIVIAIAFAVVLAYFLIPGVGCGAGGCGDVDPPLAGGPDRPGDTGTGDGDNGEGSGGSGADGGNSTGGRASSGGSGGPGGASGANSSGGGGNGGSASGGNSGGGTPGLDFDLDVNNPGGSTAGGSTGGSGRVAADLQAGPLEIVPASATTGGRLVVDAVSRTARGTLDPFLVRDFRGSRYGWTVTGTMSDFTGPGGDVISADRLVWAPRCGPHGDRQYPSTAVAGAKSSPGRTALLCSAPASDQVTGGQFDVGADLRMALPDGARTAGAYSATLVLTLS